MTEKAWGRNLSHVRIVALFIQCFPGACIFISSLLACFKRRQSSLHNAPFAVAGRQKLSWVNGSVALTVSDQREFF